jgi:hypothetical protein
MDRRHAARGDGLSEQIAPEHAAGAAPYERHLRDRAALVDERDELDALAAALPAARSALDRAGIVDTHDVRSRVVPQPA